MGNDEHVLMTAERPSDEYFKAIGKVVVEFGHFEENVSFLICVLTGGEPEIGRLLADPMEFGQRWSALRSICAYRLKNGGKVKANQKNLAKLKRLDGMVNKALGKRNVVVHSMWGKGKGDRFAHRLKAKVRTKQRKAGIVDWDYARVTLEELEEMSTYINEVARDVWNFVVSNFFDSMIARADLRADVMGE